MESQPQNPAFRNNPENFHPWDVKTGLFLNSCLYEKKSDFLENSGPYHILEIRDSEK